MQNYRCDKQCISITKSCNWYFHVHTSSHRRFSIDRMGIETHTKKNSQCGFYLQQVMEYNRCSLSRLLLLGGCENLGPFAFSSVLVLHRLCTGEKAPLHHRMLSSNSCCSLKLAYFMWSCFAIKLPTKNSIIMLLTAKTNCLGFSCYVYTSELLASLIM